MATLDLQRRQQTLVRGLDELKGQGACQDDAVKGMSRELARVRGLTEVSVGAIQEMPELAEP